MELITPNVKGVPYNPKNGVRIIDPNQFRFYLDSGLKPYDVYSSRGVVVMVFDRTESYPFYKEYMDRYKESDDNEKL